MSTDNNTAATSEETNPTRYEFFEKSWRCVGRQIITMMGLSAVFTILSQLALPSSLAWNAEDWLTLMIIMSGWTMAICFSPSGLRKTMNSVFR